MDSLIDLKTPAHMLIVDLMHESFQEGCCMLTAKYALIEHYNSVERMVSSDVIAKQDV